ncbi:hypothetical protein VE01_01580 [Pseudogymnoascus verrucosus]|uniref:Uncharacterized protein n=1 Tax=Pseudogymnoascus verrucosus TaxID=342668 RepID=A0A1B8GWY2_9PEZI|nr:uncharacterized protein VE01_01580 [Pseudogymnoascus verrucosus]OBU00362.1 hypothetical protein VE01_01580 [Pseudogymnoascus verrucosus]
MDQLMHLRDSILGYITPSKYRRSTVLPVTPSPTPNHTSTNNKWHTESHGAKTGAVLGGRISKKYLSPTDTKRHRQKFKSKGSQSSYVDDAGGESTEPDDATTRTPRTSAGGQTPASPTPKIVESIETDDTETISLEDKVGQFLEHQKAALEAGIGSGDDWHEDEHALFEELRMRGLQPLLPAHWRSDFRTVPPALFSYDPEETFINSASGHDFRGSTALLSLVTLGSRVRSMIAGSRTREEVIKKEVENYIKWAEFDGGYQNKDYIPIIAIVASTPGQDIDSISKAMTDSLESLATEHREDLLLEGSDGGTPGGAPTLYARVPPLLYGIVIAGAKVIFITFDAAKEDSKPRTIAHFDFDQATMDVWNGFAVAILVVSVRNYMMTIREHFEDDAMEISDPDA